MFIKLDMLAVARPRSGSMWLGKTLFTTTSGLLLERGKSQRLTLTYGMFRGHGHKVNSPIGADMGSLSALYSVVSQPHQTPAFFHVYLTHVACF